MPADYKDGTAKSRNAWIDFACIFPLFLAGFLLCWHGSGLIALGFVTAFLSALVVVGAFVRFISRHGFAAFAWYRIVLGSLALVLLLAR